MIFTLFVFTLAALLAVVILIAIVGLARDATARPRNHMTVSDLLDLKLEDEER